MSNAMAKRLAAKRTSRGVVSTEDGDVNVTIQQDNEIETTDLADTEPTDQNANPDAFDPAAAERDESDAKLDDAISDVDQAAEVAKQNGELDDMATAVQNLESIQLLVDRVSGQRVAVSPLTLEALQLSINMATQRVSTAPVAVPAMESMVFGHRDGMQQLSTELTAITNGIRQQHTDLKLAMYSQESIVDWVGNKWSDLFIRVYDSGHYKAIVHKVTNILTRIETEVKPLLGLSVDKAFISDPETIYWLRGITGQNQSESVEKINAILVEIESFYKDRMVNVENLATVAIDKLIDGQDFDITIREFQEAMVNVSMFDGRDIKLTGSTMYQGVLRVFGKSFKPGGGKRVEGLKTDWSNERGVAVLTGETILDLCKNTKDMIRQITPALSTETQRRQEMSAMIRLKFDQAIKASAAADMQPNIQIAKNLEKAKQILEYVNGIESIVMRSLTDNLYYLIHYIYASMTALEYIKDPFLAVREAEARAAAAAERARLEMKAQHERELRALKEQIFGPSGERVDDGAPRPKGTSATPDDFSIVIEL